MKLITQVFLCLLLLFSKNAFGYQYNVQNRKAILLVQQIAVQQFDKLLPINVSLESWFAQLVGANAGVIWQMTECGETLLPDKRSNDIKLCTEANALMPNGNKVIVLIEVGTFKRGVFGKPALNLAVIEQSDQIYKIKTLSKLQDILKGTERIPTESTEIIEILPTTLKLSIQPQHVVVPVEVSSILALRNRVNTDDKIPLPPPPPLSRASKPVSGEINLPTKLSQAEVLRMVLAKIMPVYTSTMRLMNAIGNVEVSIIINEQGKVINANAINGHPALRNSAIEAAYKWVFKPNIQNGKPVKVESTLTFTFN